MLIIRAGRRVVIGPRHMRPQRKYSIIYSDPPWNYRDKANAGKRGASHKYPTIPTKTLCRFPVESLAADDCLLALWWVPPMPEDALAVVKAWGFHLVNMKGFTWAKKTVRDKWHFGMGHYTRSNSEDVLFAVRGRPMICSHGVSQLVVAPRGRHSEKPAEVADRLVTMCGDVPRLEMFARGKRDGWDVWGDEADGGIDWDPFGCLKPEQETFNL